MTQKEFETLAGRKVKDTEDFNEIRAMYMSTDLSKEDFVHVYETPNHYDLLRSMAGELEASKKKIIDYATKREEDGKAFARIAYKDESRMASMWAINILGQREYVLYLLSDILKEGYSLSKEDAALISAMILAIKE